MFIRTSALFALFIIPFSFATAAELPAVRSGAQFNPDMSGTFSGLYQQGTGLSNDRTVGARNGFQLQEAELQLTSDVDTYLRAVVLLSIAPEAGTTEYGIGPEEVFIESLSLPAVTLKAGKFKTHFGKHNQLHTHAFPFIDAPLIHEALLGDEGLNDAGVSASVLLPTSWFSEIAIQGIALGNETLFADNTAGAEAPRSNRIGGVARYRNLFDLNSDTTLEVGISGTAGKNRLNRTSQVYGADLTLKWRPAQGGKYRAFIWSTEYLNGYRSGFTDAATGADTSRLSGIASWVQYQFAQRWWAQARGEFQGLARSEGLNFTAKQSALLGFFASEFSGFRLQLDRIHNESRPRKDHTVALQYVISIGAHPAHTY